MRHGARPGLPRVVWLLAGGSFVNGAGSFVLPFLVLYLIHQGYGGGLAAAAVAAYAAGKMAAGPAGGLLADRFGGRVTTAGSMAGSALATLTLAAVRGPGPIMVTAALTGLVAELYRPGTSAILAAEVPAPRRVTAFGVYQLGASAGAAVGPAAGGLLAEHSFLILFGCDAATSLAWAVLAWRVLPARRATPGTPRLRDPASGPVRRDTRLLRMLVVTVLVNTVLFQAQTTLPLWVHRQGLSTASYGLLLALNSALVMVLQLPTTRLTSRWRPQPVLAATSVLIGAGFTLLALAHTAPLLAAAVTVWSLGELTQWPVAAAYTTSLAPPGLTGHYAGARSLCYGLALLLAPLAGTALYRISPASLWVACGVAGLGAAAVSAGPLRIGRRQSRPEVLSPGDPAGSSRRRARCYRTYLHRQGIVSGHASHGRRDLGSRHGEFPAAQHASGSAGGPGRHPQLPGCPGPPSRDRDAQPDGGAQRAGGG